MDLKNGTVKKPHFSCSKIHSNFGPRTIKSNLVAEEFNSFPKPSFIFLSGKLCWPMVKTVTWSRQEHMLGSVQRLDTYTDLFNCLLCSHSEMTAKIFFTAFALSSQHSEVHYKGINKLPQPTSRGINGFQLSKNWNKEVTWTRPTSKTTGEMVMNPSQMKLGLSKTTRMTGSMSSSTAGAFHLIFFYNTQATHVPADQRRECTCMSVNKRVGDSGYYASLYYKEGWRGERVKHLPFSTTF